MSAAALLRERLAGRRPNVALILGSGLGALAEGLAERIEIPFADIPGFPRSSVSGHAGALVSGRLEGREVIVVSGRVHYYERGDAAAMRPVLEALATLGVRTLVLTNSAGSVRQEMAPGSVMVIADHINFSGLNPLIGEPDERRFAGMTAAYDATLRERISDVAAALGEELHSGVYMWFSGPSFETPAEIAMARTLGADAVGMSTVPETILARFLGLKVLAASVVTNYGAGMTGAELSHAETKEMAPKGGARLSRLLAALLRQGHLDD
ncbi:purine-nucleoside phosphorylase [Aurantimonas sp. Leaf443]|uniref:purine-nucleoside phosphorylase n=1 Tax=Aurantimonas sp. Leaf443 TaxID=1736378 RepID=UPI0006FF0CA7|nr:purine-nucleoside phosphorylase [Aurantimonas sp. Leaf443]KQT83049.1 purine nucleoside phosphorylase [Aurantimonas sp. Leaf443]